MLRMIGRARIPPPRSRRLAHRGPQKHVLGGGRRAREAPQAEWLAADLAEHPALCTLTQWHFPRFSSAAHERSDVSQRDWEILHEAGAEIVLAGRDHVYERCGSQNAEGQPDPKLGLHLFTVGTGGGSLYGLGARLPKCEVREWAASGALVQTLYENRCERESVPAEGSRSPTVVRASAIPDVTWRD